MHKKLVEICVIFLFIVATVIPSTGQLAEKISLSRSRGTTLYVGGDGPGNYSTIQDAVNASSDGDIVFVFQGSYHEKIMINKSISVLGENASRTFINNSGTDWTQQIILIRSHDVVFSGFTVVLEGNYVGIRLDNSQNCTLTYNIMKSGYIDLQSSNYTTIDSNYFLGGGISIASMGILSTSSANIIKHNWIFNSTYDGIMLFLYAKDTVISDNYLFHCSGQAIFSYSPYRNIIERNVIQQNISNGKNGIAFYLEYSESMPPGNIIRENDIGGCAVGIATKGDYFTITDNFVHDNDWGMELFTFSFYHVTVSNNTFMNDHLGLDLQNGMDGSMVERNVFYGCGGALNLDTCQGLTVRYNNLTSNSRAIFSAESKSNIFSQNNIIGNHRDVLSILSRDIWQGNYWNRPRFLPKLIVGILPFIQFDWHPAQQPN